MQFSSTTHLCPNILPNHTILEYIPKNRFEEMELTVDGSYTMWSFLSKLEKRVESTSVINKNATQFSGLLFWPGEFSIRVTHSQGSSLAMTFDFSRISKTSLTSVDYLKRHFINYHACFFLEQTTDGQIDLLFQVLRYIPCPLHQPRTSS